MLTVERTNFVKDGKPFFYLADTCWSAFTNITLDEWNYYLDFRAAQGFNAVQINILRQWDASGSDLGYEPFPVTHEGNQYNYDFSQLNEEYFDRADLMLQMVRDHDMIPALVLLWANYVPGTWASALALNNQIPYKDIGQYASYVTKRFKKFQPIYFVSGDADFPTDETVRYYSKAFKVVKENDPSAIYSFHIKGRFIDLPEEFLNSVDFFSYQSGHNLDGQATAYQIPVQLREKGFAGPIVNAEPCYENISYSRNKYGRYSARDVRKASWSSILSGADAGLTYGAHGIWSWHRHGQSFGIVEGEGFLTPFDWRDALHFKGANDISFLKETVSSLFEGSEIIPVSQNVNDEPSIRVASNREKALFVIYVPTNATLKLNNLGIDSAHYCAQSVDLQTRQISNLSFKDESVLNMSRAEADSLIILSKIKEVN
ncbi:MULTISPECIES: apiosidase-like domain-containing protein [unclassified Sporolactobacillus]|uniref:apiosidase-like domain-containing protein n=1 Tax=unclassified Sporolactobacillus TaxID=2628533 RepID=UPI002367B8BF|nr:DUF4038 domain-containing protein [Sporolactobacillus sp. CQH2019]MDD9149990.1 DUF4038 domain-containing protein [Sporolactobacillus sp. CQH2019]